MCDLLSCAPREARAAPPAVPFHRRRAFLRGLATLPLAAVLADPRLARAAAGSLTAVEVTAPGGERGTGFVALPGKTPAPAVLLVHEWWGLNDQIKAVASELAERGFVALAVDLYQGKVATTPAQANTYRKAMDPRWASGVLGAWVEWLRAHPSGNGKVGTVGWCFGGGWSLAASLAAPVDATVIYYGDVRRSAEQLRALRGPVLGHFGTLDERIDARMVGGFERAMAAAGKADALSVHWYVANHAFANPSGGRYDEDDARLAWARTLAFFYQHLS